MANIVPYSHNNIQYDYNDINANIPVPVYDFSGLNFNFIEVPPCNYPKFLDDYFHKYHDAMGTSIYQIYIKILYMRKIRSQKLLDGLLINSQSTELYCRDSRYCFNFTNRLLGDWWTTTDGSFVGYDIVSFVRTILGGTDLDAIEYIAENLNLDFKNKNVPQIKELDGYCFVRHSQTYPGMGIYQSPYIEGIYFNSPVFDLLNLHEPLRKYCFCNEYGHPSFFLLEWEMEDGRLHLFLTLQQPNHPHGVNVWEPIAPPIEYRIYNKHLIDAYKEREIHIHDDISNADASNTSQTIGTWAGDLSFAFDLDWSFLKGRVVKYLFNPQNPDSFEIGAKLLQIFKAMGTALELYQYYK